MPIRRLKSLDDMNNQYVLISICILLINIGISGSHEFCSVAVLILYAVTRQYAEKADFLVFWAMKPHSFLAQLKEKKLVGYLLASNFYFYFHLKPPCLTFRVVCLVRMSIFS